MLMLDEARGLTLLPGKVRHLPSGREVPLDLLGRSFPETDRIVVNQFVMPVAQDNVDTGKEFKIGFPHVLFSYAAHLAYVEVDELTGKVDVKGYLAVTEGGRIINPSGFEQQVHGAVAQGIGYGLMEEVLLDEGRILNPNFTNYIIPTSLDIPEIASVSVEMVESTGPFGMKGIGEVGTNAPLPAIAGAVEDAVGRRLSRSPLTAESILRAMDAIRSNRVRISFYLNGKETRVDVPPERKFVDVLREDLGLTGTKECCGAGECGACTILVDGQARLSCLMAAAQLQGRRVTTIEGLAADGSLHPVQEAFIEYGAVQCGFCTPGVVLAAVHLLDRNPDPTREQIREGLSGNLCRCSGYMKIVDAVEAAARKMRGGTPQ